MQCPVTHNTHSLQGCVFFVVGVRLNVRCVILIRFRKLLTVTVIYLRYPNSCCCVTIETAA